MSFLTLGMCPAMTAEVLKKLQEKGIKKVLDFISTDSEKITSLCGISYKKVLSIRRLLLAQFSAFPVNGLNLYKKTLEVYAVLPTGCSDIDALLDDGIYTNEVTELVGVSVSGKTQFCESLAVNVATTLSQNIICIDTNLGWSSERLAEILTARFPEASLAAVLSKIRLSRCFNLNQVEEVLDKIHSYLRNREDSFFASLKLIVIDSVASVLSPAFFSVDYVEGLSLLENFGRRLNALAKEFNIAVLITNHMVSSSALNDGQFETKPALGRCWTFVPSVRMIFEPNFEPCAIESFNLDRQEFSVKLDKSPRSEIRASAFRLSAAGVASCKGSRRGTTDS